MSGKANNFSVWPVGAVSNTMRSYFPDSMCPIAEANAVASSIPGILEWIENFTFSGQIGRIHLLGSCLYIDKLTH